MSFTRGDTIQCTENNEDLVSTVNESIHCFLVARCTTPLVIAPIKSKGEATPIPKPQHAPNNGLMVSSMNGLYRYCRTFCNPFFAP